MRNAHSHRPTHDTILCPLYSYSQTNTLTCYRKQSFKDTQKRKAHIKQHCKSFSGYRRCEVYKESFKAKEEQENQPILRENGRSRWIDALCGIK